MEPTRRSNPVKTASLLMIAAILHFFGCTPESHETAQARDQTAKQFFEETTRLYHLPSAEAQGAPREKLLIQAADGYAALLKKYPDQPFWAAQALRSLANVRVAQGRTSEALQLYSEVSKKYPQQDWEILQAWKSAADLLWEHNQTKEGTAFYRQIVSRFDQAAAPEIIKTIVRSSKKRAANSTDSASAAP
jgi:hypothetical protein